MKYVEDKEEILNFLPGEFFEGWQTKPTEEKWRKAIDGSDYVVCAVDEKKRKVVGYITAITDGQLSVYIPLLEVEVGYQKQGIGSELVKRMLNLLKDYYMIDLSCDSERETFYKKLGFDKKAVAMGIRRPDKI